MVVGGLLVAGWANATPVTWTIPATTMTSFIGTVTSGSISGTFVWDADTLTASNVNVTVVLNGTTTLITSAAPNYTQTSLIVFTNNVTSGQSTGWVRYTTLQNSGGTVPGVIVLAGLCNVSGGTCNSTDYGSANATLTGQLPSPSPSAVPTLSEWTQLLLALMAITIVGWHFHRERSY